MMGMMDMLNPLAYMMSMMHPTMMCAPGASGSAAGLSSTLMPGLAGMPGMQTGIPASISTAPAVLPTSNTSAAEVPSSLVGVSPPTLNVHTLRIANASLTNNEAALVSNASAPVSS